MDVQGEESVFQTSVPWANLIKMKFVLMNWNITSPKVVGNSILEGKQCKRNNPGYASKNSFLKFV